MNAKETSKFRRWINNNSVRNVIQSILAILIGLMGSFLPPVKFSSLLWWIKILILTLLVALNILFVLYYSKQDEKNKYLNQLDSKTKEVFPDLIRHISDICDDSAIGATKVIHSIKNKSEADLSIWSFKEIGNEICKLLYETIRKISFQGDDFEVIIDRLIEDGEDNKTKTISYYNKERSAPRVLGLPRNIEIDNRFDSRLFKDEARSIKVYSNPGKLQEAFYPKDSENKRKYKQGIFYPIICDDRKIVSLICVVSYNRSLIGKNDEELLDIANNYVRPYAKLALLVHKVEKSLIAKPNM